MNLENNVREVRKRKNMSALELARRAVMASSSLSLIERGLIPAYPGWRKRIAQALNVSERELFPEVQENGRVERIS